jgi:hypothetical protein
MTTKDPDSGDRILPSRGNDPFRMTDYGGPTDGEVIDLWLRFRAGERLTTRELARLSEAGAV